MDFKQKYQKAKDAGYSDEEITKFLSASDPSFNEKVKKSQDAGYSEKEVLSFFKEPPKDTRTQRQKDEELIWADSDESGEERGRAHALSRIGEGFLGTPGNIQSAIKGITGVQVGSQLPTTKDIRAFSEKATLGYTKPQNKFEEEIGNIATDIGSMATPGGASYSAARNIGIPIAGFLAKEGIEKLGVSEQTGEYAKMGTMLALDLLSSYKTLGHGGAKNYAKELWTEGEKNIPKGVSLNAKGLETELNALKTQIAKGGHLESDSKALQKIEELLGKIKNGKIPADELVATRVKINKLIESQGGFGFETHPGIRQDAVAKLNQVKDKVISTLNDYAKVNPAFGVPYKAGNEAYAVYHASNWASKYLNKYFADYLKSPALHSLFGAGVKAGAAALVPNQGIKLLYRVWKSPTLRELYGNVVKGALNNEAAVVAKNLSELRKELEKEEIKPQEPNQSAEKK